MIPRHRRRQDLTPALYPSTLTVAQDAPVRPSHLLTDIPEPNDDVDTVHIFPDYDASKLPSGETLKVLLGFHNSGGTPLNVTHIAGSLNLPNMFSFHVTNFTVSEYLSIVEPGKEASFEYRFELDPLLAGHDFQLAFTAFYADDADNYATTFYNGTLTILDPIGVFDTQTMFMYAIFASVFAFAVYFGLQATGMLPAVKKALGMGKKKRVKKTETGTRGATDDDWLKGTSWTTHKGGKSE